MKPNLELFDALININDSILNTFSKDYILRVIGLVKERATFIRDIHTESSSFFSDLIEFDQLVLQKKWNKKFIPSLELLVNKFLLLDEFTHIKIEDTFLKHLESDNLRLGELMPMLRIAVTGRLAGPSLYMVLELLLKKKRMLT